MNVKLIPAATPTEKEIEFPVLMEWIDEGSTTKGSIVYFISEDVGITLVATSNIFSGSNKQVYDSYVKCTNKSKWRPYKGKIELSNE